jgi:Fic family protein/uncharacterized protein (DUF433 family)
VIKTYLSMKHLTERVTIDPTISGGLPTIRGTEVTVQKVLGYLAAGQSKSDILAVHSILEPEDVDAAIDFVDKISRQEINALTSWGDVETVKEPPPVYKKIFRLWKHIEITDDWLNCDTSILDDISGAWFDKRKDLLVKSKQYNEFLTRLKRAHAIETGIVERMYDLSTGITETLITAGFDQSLLSHGDTNIPKATLMNHLKDHLEAIDFVFDVVKDDRPLSVSFIKQLHQLVTRHQSYAEGRDQFGNKLKIPLLRGEFKVRENNPTRDDGTMVMYCPPEHVASEMDNLVSIYLDLVQKGIHPLIIASWFHHAFTTIHPFQDGNGRVARLLATLVFVKFDFFPLTVLREEAKAKYIKGLEAADQGKPQAIVLYFAEVQKKNIQNALNIGEMASESLEEVQSALVDKLKETRKKAEEQYRAVLAESRRIVFGHCDKWLNEFATAFRKRLGRTAEISIASSPFGDVRANEINRFKVNDYFFKAIISYAKQHKYFFNRTLPKAWFAFKIQVSPDKKYQMVVTLHHYGYGDATLAIGAFLELKNLDDNESLDSTLPLPIPPHVISINGEVGDKEKNIKQYLENALTLSLAQIANELS